MLLHKVNYQENKLFHKNNLTNLLMASLSTILSKQIEQPGNLFILIKSTCNPLSATQQIQCIELLQKIRLIIIICNNYNNIDK